MGFVRTVAGDVDPAAIGVTLPHEHTQCHLWRIPERFDYWELTADEDLVASELARFVDAGGSCVVDVTLAAIGRDPAWLRRLSARTGLHVVMGCGWYREPYYPAEDLVDRRSVAELADVIVREFTEGVPGSEGADGVRVRPGIIGEIGVHKPWVSAQEERVFRAAGRAARETGMAVTTHAVMSPVGTAPARPPRGGRRRPHAGRHRPRGLVPAPRPLARDRRARSLDRVRLPRHGLHADGAQGRAARHRPDPRDARARPWRPDPPVAGRVRQQPAGVLRRQRVRVPRAALPAPAAGPRGGGGGDPAR